ncbi:MAG: hypothetical protein HRT36_04975 [Alphaproteobacteria bacterium]|nr:hypothetical protein [Alphaproteobacteria bacterium]
MQKLKDQGMEPPRLAMKLCGFGLHWTKIPWKFVTSGAGNINKTANNLNYFSTTPSQRQSRFCIKSGRLKQNNKVEKKAFDTFIKTHNTIHYNQDGLMISGVASRFCVGVASIVS